MDFLTAFPYIGILVIILINVLLVQLQDVTIDSEDEEQNPS